MGPSDIKFDLDGIAKSDAMIWLSGFSYALSGIGRRLGCDAEVSQLYLIRTLNEKYTGKRITLEQATHHPGSVLADETLK